MPEAPSKPVAPPWAGMDDFGGSDDPRDLLVPSPVPKESGGVGAPLPPIFQPLDPGIQSAVELLRLEGLSTTDSGDGYSKKEAIEAGEALDYAHVIIRVPDGERADDVIANATAIPWANYGYRTPKVELLERAPESPADEPEAVGILWEPGMLALHPLEIRRAALVERLKAAGFWESVRVSEFIRRFTGHGMNVLIPDGHPCEVEYEFGAMLDKADEQCAKVEAAKDRQDDAVDALHYVLSVDHAAPQSDATVVCVVDYPTPEALLSVIVGPHKVAPTAPGPTVAELQQQIRALQAQLTAQKASNAKYVCDATLAGLRIVAESGPLARAAELEAELKECTRLSECRWKEVIRRGEALARAEKMLVAAEAERDQERKQANEWLAQAHDAQTQLKAITALLDGDPERSPAWDDNDVAIPLPRRVEIALMPDAPGTTWIERKIKGHLDNYGVPTEYGGAKVTLASRVAMVAQAWRDLRDHVPDAREVS